ncbi:hypothetical protein SK429_23340 [Escherichia coli]|nr:hypothetical protein [Escherichia coli]MDX8077568.1 hypothetical protein [Escherichia coli]
MKTGFFSAVTRNRNGGRNLIAGSLEKVSGVAEPC